MSIQAQQTQHLIEDHLVQSCWSWYGPGERYATLPQMLSVLAAGGHIVPLQDTAR